MSKPPRLVCFALVGFICFGAQWCVLVALRAFIHPALADVVGFVLSAQLNYTLSKRITWGDRPNVSWSKYNIVVVLAALANAAVYWTLRDAGDLVALVCAWFASSALSYLLNDSFVFPEGLPMIAQEVLPISQLRVAAEGGIAIFAPAHNEAENLPKLVSSLAFYLQQLDTAFRIIIVDDGSWDDTKTVVGQLAKIHPEVSLVSHNVNRGYGAALRTGFEAGLETGLAWVGFYDGDNQFVAEDFGRLLSQAALHEADISIGYRINRADGLLRRIMGRGWHITSRWVLGYEALDVDCGMKLFRRPALEALAGQLIGDHATISPEMLVRARLLGFKTTEAGVNHFGRVLGRQSGSSLKVIMGSFRGLHQIRKTIKQELAEQKAA